MSLGLPGAYLVGRCRFPGRRILKLLTTGPFVLPPILAVLGFVMIFGNTGLINSPRRMVPGPEAPPWKMLYSLGVVVTAHVFFNFPLTLRIAGDAFALLPLNEPRAAVLTFLYCFMSFAVVLVLGGGAEADCAGGGDFPAC